MRECEHRHQRLLQAVTAVATLVVAASILAFTCPAEAAALDVNGTIQTVVASDAYDGITVRNGGLLTISGATTVVTCAGDIAIEDDGSQLILQNGATILMDQTFDEEHSIQVWDASTLTINNGTIDSSNDFQYWIQLSGPEAGPGSTYPTMNVSGASTHLTMHSGIRPYGSSTVNVTGGNVEELQARDSVDASVSGGGSTYAVLFFEGSGTSATLGPLDAGPGVTYSSPITDGSWTFDFDNATVEGYQLDLKKGASVSVSDGDGIVVSFHTPGDLGDELRIVDGQTSTPSNPYISGSITNLGTSLTFTDCDIALINAYVFGSDRVLLTNMHINEVNAEEESELIIGRKGDDGTILNCNLCYLYDSASMTVVNADIDGSENIPSATATDLDLGTVADGVMTFGDAVVDTLNVTVMNQGTVNLFNSTTPNQITVVPGATSPVVDDYAALFTATRLSGDSPVQIEFIDMSAGENLTSWTWDFGDGQGSTQQNPTHTYTESGIYDVSLTVGYAGGQRSLTKSEYIAVDVVFWDDLESGDTTRWSASVP